MRAPVLAANWKMNVGAREAAAFMRTFLARYEPHPDRTIVIFPPALSLCAVVDALRARPDVLVGVQNIYWEASGAFTGENSAPLARDAGARLVLVGHSERRHVFGEADCDVARKCAAAAAASLTPVLCVGETMEDRERGATDDIVREQLRAGVQDLTHLQMATMVVAYEPVWAIGTGHTARPEDAAAVHATIRTALRERLGSDAAQIPILYGGSVNEGNAAALLDMGEVDGLLVGGASLDAERWARIALT
ncbi:MAG TPA: triose-phosphate isomerase [Gemmatimonadaceae bacterium]|nr:triose-phosphate isomerase [Gemmatimonadaceae bacterium]